MNSKIVLNTILLMVIICVSMINGEGYDMHGYCTLLPENTKIASTESCQKYYVCKGGRAFATNCLNDLSFDKNSQTCKPSSQVKCAGISSAKVSCAGIAEGFVAVPNSCSDYAYCKNGVYVGQTSCPNGLTFNNGVCDYTKCTENGIKGQLTSSCDVIPENVFYGSTMSCSDYQICIKDQFYHSNCEAGSVFNIQKQVCSWASSGNYCDHVTEAEVLPSTETYYPSCSKENEKTPSKSDCSVYYICKNAKKIKYNCGKNEFFDTDFKDCRERQMAKPHEDCDRCMGSTKTFVNAVDTNCMKYLGCVDGKKSYTNSCPKNTYLDEEIQICLSTSNLPTYRLSHGSCRLPSAEYGPPTPPTPATTKSTTTTTKTTSTTTPATTTTSTTTTSTTTPDTTTPDTTTTKKFGGNTTKKTEEEP